MFFPIKTRWLYVTFISLHDISKNGTPTRRQILVQNQQYKLTKPAANTIFWKGKSML